MVATRPLLTADAFWAFARRPENADRRFELIEGVIVEMPPSGGRSALLGAAILAAIFAHVRAHDLGYVSGADGGYRLDARTVLVPDVGFIARARLADVPPTFFEIPPDLAVEVVSPTDSIRAVQRKAMRYLAAGTRAVWIIYPDDHSADVYRALPDGATGVTQLGLDDALDGGDVLPGFALPLRRLFESLPPAPDSLTGDG